MAMVTASTGKPALLALIAAALFAFGTHHLKSAPRKQVRVEMQVALPLFVQVFMAAGDRFLAANMGTIRALVVETPKMKPDEFAILAKVQGDVSRLNPGHEDNYYSATAILPWYGEVDATQRILFRAAKARPYDYQPAFYYGFNLLHFKGDSTAAALWMREAATTLPEGNNRLQMQNLAAIWLDKADDVEVAIRVVENMAREARRPDFKRYLESRIVRLHMLQDMRRAAAEYGRKFGRPPTRLDDLVEAGFVTALPQDPFGFGFAFDRKGNIVLRNRPPLVPPQKK